MDEASEDGDNCCPLCMEEMDSTDRQLKPCPCGYQICVWCWNHIMEMAEKDSTEGRCPACRTPYDKEKIVATTVSCDRPVDVYDKKQRSGKGKVKASEGRKSLSNVRVIQRNLVYVVGVPATLADEEMLERKEYFGQYGKILKISVSKSSGHSTQHSMVGSSVSVYVTYMKEEDALRCIQAVNGYVLEGKVLKACFGTTKYCNAWLKHMPCNNPDCLYLHDEGTREDSFTKEQMLAKYGSKNQHFHDLTHPSQRRSGAGLPPPVIDVPTASFTSHAPAIPGNLSKPSLSNGNFMKPSSLPAAASWGSRTTSSPARATQGRNGAGSVSTKLKIATGPAVNATPAPAGLGTHGMPTNGQPLQTFPINQYGGVKNMKANITEGANMSFPASAAATARLLEETDSLAVSSMMVGSGACPVAVDTRMVSCIDTRTNACVNGLVGKEKNEVAGDGLGWAASHNSRSSPGESIDPNAKAVEPLNLVEPVSSVSLNTSIELDGKDVADILEERECSWTSPAHESLGDNVDMIGPSSITSSESSHIGEDVTQSAVDCEILPSCGRLSLNVDTSDRSASGSGNVVQDSLDHAKQVISEAAVRTPNFTQMNTPNHPANTANDPMQTRSLSVGGLSIHLNADISSNMLGIPSGNKDNSRAHTSSDALPMSLSFESLRSSLNEDLPSCMVNGGGKLSKEGSFYSGSSIENLDLKGQWESNEDSTKGSGEHKLISDIFATGFDIWTDGNPQDLAQLLFNGKQIISPSSHLKETSAWKSASNKQSRFHFARLDESGEETPSSSRKTSHTSASTFVHGNDNQVSVERYNMNPDSSDAVHLVGFSVDGTSSSLCDQLLNKTSCSGTSAESFALPSISTSKSSMSAPPGFSSTRVSAIFPPGFPVQSRPLDSWKNANQDSGSSRSILATGNHSPLETVNTSNDVEFLDPAIMAVGRGKLPSGMRPTVPFAGNPPLSGFFPQAPSLASPLSQQPRPLDVDSHFQNHPRHLYGNFGGMNSVSQLGFANQEPDMSLPSLFPSTFNEVMNTPRLVGQYQDVMGSGVSHVGIQEPGYGHDVPHFRFQESPGNAWHDWNRSTPSTEANTGTKWLVNDTVGHMSMPQMSLDRVLQSQLEELALTKELGSNYFADAVSVTGHDDQGPFSNARINRYFLQN